MFNIFINRGGTRSVLQKTFESDPKRSIDLVNSGMYGPSIGELGGGELLRTLLNSPKGPERDILLSYYGVEKEDFPNTIVEDFIVKLYNYRTYCNRNRLRECYEGLVRFPMYPCLQKTPKDSFGDNIIEGSLEDYYDTEGYNTGIECYFDLEELDSLISDGLLWKPQVYIPGYFYLYLTTHHPHMIEYFTSSR